MVTAFSGYGCLWAGVWDIARRLAGKRTLMRGLILSILYCWRHRGRPDLSSAECASIYGHLSSEYSHTFSLRLTSLI
jgi:hypothetical protein